MRALVIDDSRTARAIIGTILRDAGLEVAEAGTARDGLAWLQREADLDLVLVDWNMPGMSGLDFVKTVRADRTYDPLRIMMVTTETEQQQLVRALEAGADEYLMKPFTRDDLVAKIGLLGMTGE